MQSQAAATLFMWIRAVLRFHKVSKPVQPRRLVIRKLEVCLRVFCGTGI